jgi:antitoxin ParD1/3/4
MNVILPRDLEQFVSRKVESGQYHSESEVILEGLRLLREKDKPDQMRLESIRNEIAVGIQEIERGEYTEYDEGSLKEMLEQVRARGRQKLAERANKSQR